MSRRLTWRERHKKIDSPKRPQLVFASDLFRKSKTTEQTQTTKENTTGKQPQKELSTEEQTPIEMNQSEDVKAKEATRTDDINLHNPNPTPNSNLVIT